MMSLTNLRPLNVPAFIREDYPLHRVYRSAALRHYGHEGVKYICRELGLQVHLDLRSEEERKQDPPFVLETMAFFKRTIAVPITTMMPSPSNSQPTAKDYVQYYYAVLYSSAAFSSAFITVGEYIEQGILFSCSQGKDRTGLLAAAILEAAGCSRAVILSDYAKTMQDLATGECSEPRNWEKRGLDRAAYLRRYELGDAPLRLLLQELDFSKSSLLQIFRFYAEDRLAFDNAVKRISTSE
jgi:protein-tyrosine phosphatase